MTTTYTLLCPWCKQPLIDVGSGWLDQVGEGYAIPARIYRCGKNCHEVEITVREDPVDNPLPMAERN